MSGALARPRPADGTAALRSYLLRLEHMLDASVFLLGQQPGVADFAVYHPLWFNRTQTPAMADVLQACPKVLAWMDRMAAIGHGQIERFSAQQAIDLARQSTPRSLECEPFHDEHGIALGSRVSVAAEGFGPEPTEGHLLAATASRYVLGRSDERAGRVQVHFPRVGYALRALKD
jgi:hypothetical protein